MTKRAREHPKPPLTRGGVQVAKLAHDAPRPLVALAMTQTPPTVRGPAMRGAFARGWCDGVRGKKASANPYVRGGSGWQHGMSGVYVDGWRAGKRVARIDKESDGLTDRQFQLALEVRERAYAIMRGEIVSERSAVASVARVEGV